MLQMWHCPAEYRRAHACWGYLTQQLSKWMLARDAGARMWNGLLTCSLPNLLAHSSVYTGSSGAVNILREEVAAQILKHTSSDQKSTD
jgi:hypothetical protein